MVMQEFIHMACGERTTVNNYCRWMKSPFFKQESFTRGIPEVKFPVGMEIDLPGQIKETVERSGPVIYNGQGNS